MSQKLLSLQKRALVMKPFIKICILAAALTAAACSVKPREVAYTTPEGFVNIISFNIRQSGMAEKDGPDRWENRREAVLNMIERESPSVLGLQEGLINQVRYIEQAFPQFARVGVGRDDGNEQGEIMAVFYRNDYFELLDSGTFWLSETPDEVSRGWDGACNRTVTWVKLQERATKKVFWYLNTHLDHIGEQAREESCRLIARFVGEKIPAEEALIIGGDLNSTIDDPIFDPLKAVADVARDTACPTDRRGTFNGFGSAPSNIVIDHLFCRGTESCSLRTLRDDYGAPFISDHYPVALLVKLP